MRHSARVSSKRVSGRFHRAMMEALDRRTLLSVAFKFNIIDPVNQLKSVRAQLQTLLDAAGGEWAQHLNVQEHDVTLEYDVSISNEIQSGAYVELARGAAKSGQVISADSTTGLPVYQVGTVTEMKTGVDPNGSKADGGIVIFAKYIKQFYFDPALNRRTDPIPAGSVDGYSVILHELAHSLGFVSTRDPLGNLPTVGMYQYDQHVTVARPGFYTFGTGTRTFNFQTFQFDIDDSSDSSYKVYGGPVPMEAGNPNHLGVGSRADAIKTNPTVLQSFTDIPPELLDDLSTDLLGGIVLPGERKTISKLDLAILQDSGTPVNLNLATNPEGIFEINGTGLSDVIDISLTNGNLLVRVNDAVQSFDQTQSQLISAIVINGLAGNDNIFVHGEAPAVAINGGAGNDTIIGGPKGDGITGGGGNDLLYGGKGGDIIRGGDSKDTIYGQGGSDRLYGDASNDHMDGGAQTDRVFGGGGTDVVIGGTENDFLYGEGGNDVVSGAGGKDRMDGGSGADAFYGGAGNDSVDYSGRADAGVTVTLDGNADDGAPLEGDNIFDAENVIGSPFDDKIVGNESPNSLLGGGGDDTVDGGGGNDTIEGNGGHDVIIGSGGHDSLVGGDGNDRVVGGSGRDHLIGDIGDDTFIADESEIDTLDGGDGNDNAGVDADDILDSIETPTIDAL